MGFETVRNIAMSLIMLDSLQNKSQASQLKDEVVGSFFSGVLQYSWRWAQYPRCRGVDDLLDVPESRAHVVTYYFFEETRDRPHH